jgi:HlyD family secretion protein
MHRNYIYFVLALTVFCLFLILNFFIQKPGKEEVAKVQTERPPFPTYISGVGIVEPKSGNIHISSSFNRVVEKIDVSTNQKIEKGDVLFQLYRDDLLALLKIKQQEYEKGLANLQKLQSLPRSEDLTIANEGLDKAQAMLSEAKAQYDMIANLSNPRAISKEEQDKRYYRYQQAEAELKEAQAQHQKIKSGAWQPELNIAQHEVEQLKAAVDATELEIQRTSVKSPLNGTVLKINIREGELLDPNKTAMVLGDIEELYLRVSINQYNITMFHSNGPAVAFRQGDHTTEFPLKLIRIDPLMVPKKYLTNDVNEKVDTQVVEIIYSIAKKDADLIIGEQMDVYIDAEKK